MRASPDKRSDPPEARATLTVLQVVPALDSGGVERTARDVSLHLTRLGHRSIVASSGGRLAREIERAGGRHVTLPLASKQFWTMGRNAAALARLIEAEGVDIVHARSRAPAWSALIAARRTSTPFVTTYHGAYGQAAGCRGAVKGFYNGVMARGDVVIANSAFTRDLVLARHKPDPARLCVIHRGTDMDVFDPARISAADRLRQRANWGVSPDETAVLLPARLTGWKGHRTALRAAALVQQEGAPNLRLIFAGDVQGRDLYRAEIAGLAEELGVRLEMSGHLSDMPLAYASADLILAPSTKPEAFGRTAIEAQAMGRPVIVADHGAAPETVLVGDAPTGWRVPPGDAEALAGAMREALAMDGPAREALSARAREQAARFALPRMLGATLEVYERLAARR